MNLQPIPETVRRAWREGYRFRFLEGNSVNPYHPDGRKVPEWLAHEDRLTLFNGARVMVHIFEVNGAEAALDVAEGRRGISGVVHVEGTGVRLPFRQAPGVRRG